jgi:hypothetical protein
MRMLMTIIVLIAAAAVVDSLFFDGQYRKAVWEEANYQGQQFRYQIDSTVLKHLFP